MGYHLSDLYFPIFFRSAIMQKLKTYVFSAIVFLVILLSDEAESRTLEIDRRLERAVEEWRNGTSFAQADADTSDSGSNHQSIDYHFPDAGIKYGCYLSQCWRSCKKGEQDLCENDEWCYSNLGICTFDFACDEALKVPCYGTAPGEIKETGCPGFKGYLCDAETETSFGCSKSRSYCWRSCDKEEMWCNRKMPDGGMYCYVDAGTCTYDKRCSVATALNCDPKEQISTMWACEEPWAEAFCAAQYANMGKHKK